MCFDFLYSFCLKHYLLIPWSRVLEKLPLHSTEIFRILWNPKVHYRVYKSPPPVPILSQIDLVRVIL